MASAGDRVGAEETAGVVEAQLHQPALAGDGFADGPGGGQIRPKRRSQVDVEHDVDAGIVRESDGSGDGVARGLGRQRDGADDERRELPDPGGANVLRR